MPFDCYFSLTLIYWKECGYQPPARIFFWPAKTFDPAIKWLQLIMGSSYLVISLYPLKNRSERYLDAQFAPYFIQGQNQSLMIALHLKLSVVMIFLL